MQNYPWTGQDRCYDEHGLQVPCAASGQDAEHRPGRPWPLHRFAAVAEVPDGELIHDSFTGLYWPRDANPAGWPMPYAAAGNFISQCNDSGYLGRNDWRLPSRREMLSVMCLANAKPALPTDHPFRNIFQHWCWTGSRSVTARNHIWRVHLEGGRMFSGPQDAEHIVWPVAGISDWLIAETPEIALTRGASWPRERFTLQGESARDNLTGLIWRTKAWPSLAADADAKGGWVDIGPSSIWGMTTWSTALAYAREVADKSGQPWRLPTILELETLVDATVAWPALPRGHPFRGLGLDALSDNQPAAGETPLASLGVWSSTTSGYDPAWAWVLYLGKGAIGVGHKPGVHFPCLLVRT